MKSFLLNILFLFLAFLLPGASVASYSHIVAYGGPTTGPDPIDLRWQVSQYITNLNDPLFIPAVSSDYDEILFTLWAGGNDLAARHRWNIESEILIQKHHGYQYEHCFS